MEQRNKMELRVDHIVPNAGDVLLVFGALVNEKNEAIPIVGKGWISATINHYDSECYYTKDDCPDFVSVDEKNRWLYNNVGHRKDSAIAREMTEDEKLDYAKSLLWDVIKEKVNT